MTYPDYIGREAVRRLSDGYKAAGGIGAYEWPREADHPAVIALCQLLTETGFKEPEPRDLVMARRLLSEWERAGGYEETAAAIERGSYDDKPAMKAVRALLREYAGEEA